MTSGRKRGENREKAMHYDDSQLARSATILLSETQEGKDLPDHPGGKSFKNYEPQQQIIICSAAQLLKTDLLCSHEFTKQKGPPAGHSDAGVFQAITRTGGLGKPGCRKSGDSCRQCRKGAALPAKKKAFLSARQNPRMETVEADNARRKEARV